MNDLSRSVRKAAKSALTPKQVDAVRDLRARLYQRLLDSLGDTSVTGADLASLTTEDLAAIVGAESDKQPGANRTPGGRTNELLRLAQAQRDAARDEVRQARLQRDQARSELRELRQRRNAAVDDPGEKGDERRALQELVKSAQHRREEIRERIVESRADQSRAREVMKVTQNQRDAARNELQLARQQRDKAAQDRTALREQRDKLRAELDLSANPDLAAPENFARMRQHRAWRPGTAAPPELRDMGYGPVGPQNPVLSMMYSRLVEQGVTPVPLRRIHVDRPPELRPGSILNLHWTRFVQVGCETVEQAAHRTEQLVDVLSVLRDDGISLVWTIHEELPHDCPFPDVEAKLRGRLAELASTVHVLHESTIDAVKPYYELDPAKVLVVEHPLYKGVYPDYVTRESARAALGIQDDEFTVLVFGAIRPYKGIDRILTAASELSRKKTERRLRVVIAGPTFESVDTSQLVLRARSTPGVTIEPKAIHSQHIQYLFRAADLVALPYTGFLNSGVLLLGLTFECPVLAPENPVTLDMLGSGLVRLFDQSSSEAFVAEIERALEDPSWLPTGPLDPDFAKFHDPMRLAGKFAEGLVAMNPEGA